MLNDCKAMKTEAYCNTHRTMHDLTGNIGCYQDPNVSISEEFRKGIYLHLAVKMNPKQLQDLYKLGKSTYFSESAYDLGDDFENRYWGANKERLREIKSKYDPEGLLKCYNCIGTKKVPDTPPKDNQLLIILLSVGGGVVLLVALFIGYRCYKGKQLKKSLIETDDTTERGLLRAN